MQRIAVISDIHSNLPALEAVLDDIGRRGITRIVCLGDLIGKGPEPSGTIALIRETCETVVQGNWDHGITLPQTKPAGIWQRERLSDSDVDYLLSLPFHFDVMLSGKLIRMYHASARSIYHRVLRKADKAAKLGLFDETDATGRRADGRTPDIVVYGDIHAAYYEIVYRKDRTAVPETKQGLQICNTGSAGLPYDGIPEASYLVLEGSGESGTAAAAYTSPASFAASFVRVPYDIERAVRVAARVGLPNLERYAFELRTATEMKSL